jgi:(p)ppGpp synthase/HD superfamily hydrolase
MSQDRILKAIEFAFSKHAGQYRKGTVTPYIVHPLGVMNLLLAEQAGDPGISDDVIIAGILHDVYEDTDVSLYEVERMFGAEVRRLVENASEPKDLREKGQDVRETWKERKLHTIEHLHILDRPSKIISCCDKCHNARSMNEDYLLVGESLWDRFNSSKEDIQWYYEACLEAYTKGHSIENTRVFTLLRSEVETLCSH